eukprot:TRINITY_DN46100_c0_g1_i1.p1 TRINITY_DN46100_c0_g1~~TRINITY_DN46100_c0_g1_i1.p1  ORF type:complete len:184 (-),score=31.44 TRINITY_DN46100_c0_g1_i1:232-783(-)
MQPLHEVQQQFEVFGQRQLADGSTWSQAAEFANALEHIQSMSDAECERYDAQARHSEEVCKVTFLDGSQTTISVPTGAKAAIIREKITDTINEAMEDSDPHPGLDESQVAIVKDGVEVNYSRSITVEGSGENEVMAVFQEDDWQESLRGMPNKIQDFLWDLRERPLYLEMADVGRTLANLARL